MEITIGVRNVAREITLESAQTPDEVVAAVTEALKGEAPLILPDEKGRQVVVPAGALGYVEIGSPEQRRVGFGLV
ncbi:DUF3107 domain-containing protein [Georgenia sp. TF02-10]|uniref:DUF3107 domain-containing protein n=1 Tax=Georgenia sp. TF02-10 TaxID=2917725 RepID=UPI001FA7F985|nr:DUF3107 domain-containing protein [Georgenia sp. TF02-10]UNX54161.1 DUF3107 domain-containing protein [Georgenia sp. TF02-10]